MKKNGGFTILEIMVVCCIVLILSSIASVSLMGRMEKDSVVEAKIKITTMLNNITTKAMNNGEIYDVKFNLQEKYISVLKNGNIEIERIELPKMLEYEDINGKKIINRKTTSLGNMSMPFSIYGMSKSKENIYFRITTDTTSPIRVAIIRSYRPTEKINKDNYKKEESEKYVWIKE